MKTEDTSINTQQSGPCDSRNNSLQLSTNNEKHKRVKKSTLLENQILGIEDNDEFEEEKQNDQDIQNDDNNEYNLLLSPLPKDNIDELQEQKLFDLAQKSPQIFKVMKSGQQRSSTKIADHSAVSDV